MKANIGCILRVAPGVALIALAATGVVSGWGWLCIIPLVTGLIRFCPVYTLPGFRTCSAGACSVPKQQQ